MPFVNIPPSAQEGTYVIKPPHSVCIVWSSRPEPQSVSSEVVRDVPRPESRGRGAVFSSRASVSCPGPPSRANKHSPTYLLGEESPSWFVETDTYPFQGPLPLPVSLPAAFLFFDFLVAHRTGLGDGAGFCFEQKRIRSRFLLSAAHPPCTDAIGGSLQSL